MNRNKLYYYRTGSRIARKALFKNIGLCLKYSVYLIANVISKMVFFLQPIFTFGHLRLIEDVIEHNDFKFETIFDDANSSKKYWTSLMVYFIQMGLLIAGAGVIFLITLAAFKVGVALDEMSNLYIYIFQFIFMIPGVIVGVWFVTYITGKFGPTSSIIKDEENVAIGEVLYQNFRIMDKSAIVSLFNIHLINLLKMVFWSVLGYLLILYTDEQFDIIVVSIVLILVICFLARLLIEKLLAAKISTVLLIEDLKKKALIHFGREDEVDEHERQLIALFESLPDEPKTEKNVKGDE